ncbi:MAG: type IV pilus secretin PilQ [Desulfuromonadia bacterium]
MGSSNRRALLAVVGLVTVLSVAGCAQRKVAFKEPDVTALQQPATLQSVVSNEGGIDIRLDRAVPYTFYKVENPPRGVVDISPAARGSVPETVPPAAGGRPVTVTSVTTAGLDSVKIEFPLDPASEVDLVADTVERGKLSVRITPPQKGETPTPSPTGQVSPPPPASPSSEIQPPTVAKTEPATPLQTGPALTAILPVDDGIELAVTGTVTSFNAFKLSRPERLVIDLFSTANALPSPLSPIGRFGISQARVGKTADKIRIVLDASNGEIPPYTLTRNDRGILLRFQEPPRPQTTEEPRVAAAAAPKPAVNDSPTPSPAISPTTSPVETAGSSPPEPVTSPIATSAPVAATPPPLPATRPGWETAASSPPLPSAPRNSVEAIDFTLRDGYSRIEVMAGKGCLPGTPLKTKDGVVLTISNCRMPKHLQRFIDTSAFASVVTGITPYEVKGKKRIDAKLLARLRADAPSRVAVSGGTITWEIKNTELPPPPKGDGAKKSLEVISGTAPTKEPADAPLPPSVAAAKEPTENRKVYTGRRVTLEFSDADIRKIFQLIAEVSNLNFLIADDVSGQISIKLVNVPWDQALDVILETKQLAMKREGNIVQIMPKAKMVSREEEERQAKEAIEKAMELKTVIFDVNYAKIDDVAAQFTAIKSKRGSITRDARTNRIIVKDIQPAIDDMRFLLKNLDLPERQVMIEARIVEASSNFTRDLGVKWSTNYLDGSASKLNINSIDSSFGGVVSTTLPTTTTGGLAMGMSFGKLTSNVQLDMRLSAAATIGQVKVISTPKVLTLNNKKAKISQGQSVPYQTVSAEGTKTEFVEAVLTLEVTPHITSDGSVSMEIKASNNSVGSGTPPPINKKEATTELVLKNGETTVIGGIYIDSDTTTETGVPFLMDIPLLGWLFKSNSKNKTKTELLIFITPKVIS